MVSLYTDFILCFHLQVQDLLLIFGYTFKQTLNPKVLAQFCTAGINGTSNRMVCGNITCAIIGPNNPANINPIDCKDSKIIEAKGVVIFTFPC